MIQSPENIVLTCDGRGIPFSRPLELTNDDPEAITICVLNTPAAPVVITTTAGAHMFIYTALQICATTAKAPQREAILKKHGCKVVHGTLDEGVLQRFNTLLEQGRGFPRYSVISARLWLDPAESVHAPFSVLAFWNGKAFADQAVVSLLVKTFQLKTPFFLAHAQDEMAEWR